MTDDQQRAREFIAYRFNIDDDARSEILHDHVGTWQPFDPATVLELVTAALRAAPEGWSFQRQGDGSIVVTAESYGVVHVRPDDSDSIAAAMLHLLADDLAARPQGVR